MDSSDKIPQTVEKTRDGPGVVVAAVFATMNRPDVALGCVRALAGQTRAPDLVVVALNAPRDGTREAILSNETWPFRLELHEMAENGGNAGGVEAAVGVAESIGVDAMWVLDDDSWPRPAALEHLLTGLGKGEKVAAVPLQVDPGTKDIAWPLVILDGEGKTLLVRKLEDLPEQTDLVSRPSWTGTLYPIRAMLEAGRINGELFIRGEDEEYPMRVARAGWSFHLCPEAVLDHPGPKDLVHRKILGKNFFWEPDLPEWKMYYKVRNLVWMRKCGGLGAGAGAVVQCFCGCLTLDRPGVGRWKVFWKAVTDGWCGRLGRVLADWAP